MTGRKSLFIFLMGLAWKCRYSMPLLLSGTVAILGRAWMFQIRVHTVHRLHENELLHLGFKRSKNEPCVYTRSKDKKVIILAVYVDDAQLAYYDEEEDQEDDEGTWESESSDSWETIVEEVAYG